VCVTVAVLDDYQDVARDLIDGASVGIEVTSFTHHIGNVDELVDALAGYPVVVAMRERTPFPAEVLDRLGDLRLLVTTGPGNAAIDVRAAERCGIVVCGTDALVSPTVELTWALILSLLRHVPQEDAAVREGKWQTTLGAGLEGGTLGLLGLGRVGSRVATIGQAFGMRTIAWSQNLTSRRAAALGVTAVDREDIFGEPDVLSIHLRLSERTRGLVGAAELARMRSSAVLINTARAAIVDRPSLLEALATGALAGAGLDVFDREPLPTDDPFRRLPNTVLTPHVGYVTHESYEVFFDGVREDIEAFRAGEPVRVLRG
jgi:phosphoglycerate dehydrogenase-like enzyme